MRSTKSSTAALMALTVVMAAGHAAAARGDRLSIPEQSLDQALHQLVHATHIELLFDSEQVAGLRSRAVHGELAPEQALRIMLSDAGLSVRRTATGGYVILPGPRPTLAAPSIPAPAVEIQNTVAEILVTSALTQNVDIRRSVNDIQPYKVLGSGQILDAQADDVEDLLRQRLASNIVVRSLAQAPVASVASNRSQVNLRGMGQDQTLILLDGRRLPASPGYQAFEQPDLNGLPAIAIDRIETLSSTAGGIYGPGATGGVVNIVLKRNYYGGEIETGAGVTQRGDAPQWRAGLVLGGSWLDDRLHLFASVARQHNTGLAFGDRPFVQRSLVRRQTNGSINLPVSPSWNLLGLVILNDDHASDVSTAPLSVTPGSVAGQASFVANAGKFDVSLSDDGQGRLQSLLTTSTADSIILSGRLEFSDRLQVFVDLLALQNTGTATGPRLDTSLGVMTTLPDGERFPEEVRINFPTPGWKAPFVNRSRTTRASVGAILRLGRTWSAELDATLGEAHIRSRQPASGVFADIVDFTGLDPAQGYQAVQAALAPYADLPSNTAKSTNRLVDVSLRAGGAIGRAPAGPMTLTTMVEARRDRMPDLATADLAHNGGQIYPVESEYGPAYDVPNEDQVVYSAYGELRAPITALGVSLWLLRGLEGQLALRADRYVYRIPVDLKAFAVPIVTSRDNTLSLTAGFKAWPLDALMIRGSYATGYVAPSLVSMTPLRRKQYHENALDPRRPGERAGGDEVWDLDYNGSPAVRPERARALTAGFVLASASGRDFRLAVDFTHLVKSREVSHFFDGDVAYVLAHEADLPGLVTRAPLTDSDRANGLTAGVVTRIDTAANNLGRTVADTLEVSLDHRAATSVGVFQTFVEGSWTPKFRRLTNPGAAAFDARGTLDGPLPLRGVLGTRWTHSGWTAGITAQAYGGSRVSYADPDPNYTLTQYSIFNVRANGGDKVPPQVYFDADLAYRPPSGAGRDLIYRFGMRNLLDRQPPPVLTPIRPVSFINRQVLADPGLGYSTLGDPRGRRFVASIEMRF